MEYRRGTDGFRWQKVWHVHEQCKDYPTRSFQIAEYHPSEENICKRCSLLRRQKDLDS